MNIRSIVPSLTPCIINNAMSYSFWILSLSLLFLANVQISFSAWNLISVSTFVYHSEHLVLMAHSFIMCYIFLCKCKSKFVCMFVYIISDVILSIWFVKFVRLYSKWSYSIIHFVPCTGENWLLSLHI